MGWSTELFCNISFNRESFNSKYEVEDRIDLLHKQIDTCKSELKKLAYITEPEKWYNKEDYDCPESYIDDKLLSNLDLLQELIIEEYKLELLLNNWDNCHDENGLAIDSPDGIDWNTAFLEGDFVRTVKYPKCNE